MFHVKPKRAPLASVGSFRKAMLSWGDSMMITSSEVAKHLTNDLGTFPMRGAFMTDSVGALGPAAI